MIKVKILKGGGYRQESYSFIVKNPEKIEFYQKMQYHSTIFHGGNPKIIIEAVK